MKKDRFTGTIVKRTKRNLVLLRNVYDSTGRLYRDHVWVDVTDFIDIIKKYNWGSIIKFDAIPFLEFDNAVLEMKPRLKNLNNYTKIGEDMKILKKQETEDREKFAQAPLRINALKNRLQFR